MQTLRSTLLAVQSRNMGAIPLPCFGMNTRLEETFSHSHWRNICQGPTPIQTQQPCQPPSRIRSRARNRFLPCSALHQIRRHGSTTSPVHSLRVIPHSAINRQARHRILKSSGVNWGLSTLKFSVGKSPFSKSYCNPPPTSTFQDAYCLPEKPALAKPVLQSCLQNRQDRQNLTFMSTAPHFHLNLQIR